MGRELVDELRPVTGLAGEQPEDGQFEDALAQLGAPGFLFGTHSFNVIPASMRNKLDPPPRWRKPRASTGESLRHIASSLPEAAWRASGAGSAP